MQSYAHRLKMAAIVAMILTTATIVVAGGLSRAIIGFPPTRYYSLEEIGNVSLGAKLGFDALGRLGVIDNGAYVVLNDNTWTDLLEKTRDGDIPVEIALKNSAAPTYYYGAVGSWGTLELQPNGKLRPKSLRPAKLPAWVAGTNFIQVLPVAGGVYFAGNSGVVYWDTDSRTCHFYEIDNTAIFSLAEKTYAFSRARGILALTPDGMSPVITGGTAFLPGEAIEKTTLPDKNKILIATTYRRLLVFDGSTLSPWTAELDSVLTERIADVECLGDGEVAVAVRKKGLFILSSAGELLRSLTSPEYEGISDVAVREPGILWMSTNRGIEKVLYKSPFSIVDQRVGIEGGWPIVTSWEARTVISTSGRLFEETGSPVVFRQIAGLESHRAQAVAVNGPHLLFGNAEGAYAVEKDAKPVQILRGMQVDRLVMLAPDICFVLGGKQITALRYENGSWAECTDRVPGIGFPYLAHSAKSSVWIECGLNRVVRLSLRAGKIHTQIMESFPWKEPRWVNIGIIGNIVVLTGPVNGRVFFDEDTETFCEAPRIQSILQQSPYWILRAAQDSAGTIWGSHEHGVVRFIRSASGYSCDHTTFDLVRDRHPIIQIVNGRDVWLATRLVLYRIDRNFQHTAPTPVRPVLASVHDVRTGLQLFGAEPPAALPRLPYAQNSLSFRFFVGGYGLQSPTYEFRMNEKSSNWSVLGSDSLLTLPNLREGAYNLEIRLSDLQGPVGIPLSLKFEIDPPWYRTWAATSAYAILGLVFLIGVAAWFSSRARLRNVALEKLVGERTEALRQTMEKLNDETRNAATLAERGRLANEIHDSVQQGLSGLILQLDSTLKLPGIDAGIRARIDGTRKMVAFTREELRHALWDMESPLLENTELGDALTRMGSVVGAVDTHIGIRTTGEATQLTQSTKHHLLRIAQEAMTNAVRHSEADNISVELVYGADQVSISVADDGVGFQPTLVPTNGIGHFGLRSIRTRASQIGGDLKITSEPNHGTSITIIVPATPAKGSPSHADTHHG